MSEKQLPERVGILESKFESLSASLGERVKNLEGENEKRKNNIISGMWKTIRLLLAVTILTATTEKFRKSEWIAVFLNALGL